MDALLNLIIYILYIYILKKKQIYILQVKRLSFGGKEIENDVSHMLIMLT